MSFRVVNSSSRGLQREFRFFQPPAPIVKEIVKETVLEVEQPLKQNRNYDQVTKQDVSISFDSNTNRYRFQIKKPENDIYVYQVWEEENVYLNSIRNSYKQPLRYWIDTFITSKQKGFFPTTLIEINNIFYISILVDASIETVENDQYCILYFNNQNILKNNESISQNIPEGDFTDVRLDIDANDFSIPSSITSNNLYTSTNLKSNQIHQFIITNVTDNKTIFSGYLYSFRSGNIAKAQWVTDLNGNTMPIYPYPSGNTNYYEIGNGNITNSDISTDSSLGINSGALNIQLENPFSVQSISLTSWTDSGNKPTDFFVNQLLQLDDTGKVLSTITTPLTYIPDNQTYTIDKYGNYYINNLKVTDPSDINNIIGYNSAGISFLINAHTLCRFWSSLDTSGNQTWNYILVDFTTSLSGTIDLAGPQASILYSTLSAGRIIDSGKIANVSFNLSVTELNLSLSGNWVYGSPFSNTYYNFTKDTTNTRYTLYSNGKDIEEGTICVGDDGTIDFSVTMFFGSGNSSLYQSKIIYDFSNNLYYFILNNNRYNFINYIK
jgi:hypothetical protein